MADQPQIPFTLEAYATLKAAYSQGAARVKYDGKEIDFRSRADMEVILQNMEKELFPNKKTISRTYIKHNRGFN
jgi:hypothetical protein